MSDEMVRHNAASNYEQLIEPFNIKSNGSLQIPEEEEDINWFICSRFSIASHRKATFDGIRI